MYISMEQIASDLRILGYMEFETDEKRLHLLYKTNAFEGTKCIAIVRAYLYNHRTIEECKQEIFEILRKSRVGLVAAENMLFIIQGLSGTRHHFYGKNVVFINGRTNKISSTTISKEMAEEINILKGYYKRECVKDKIFSLSYPEQFRHSTIPLIVLIMITCLFYVVGLPLDNELGYSTQRVLDGKWSTLFTYMFAHASLFHLLGNMSALYCVGSIVMQIEGFLSFSYLYFTSGFLVAFIDCILTRLGSGNPEIVTVGASGAIFSLIGALLVESFFDYYIEQNRKTVLKYVVLTYVLSSIGRNINVRAHSLGLLLGIILMLIHKLVFKKINKAKLYHLKEIDSKHEEKKDTTFLCKLSNDNPFDFGPTIYGMSKGRKANPRNRKYWGL